MKDTAAPFEVADMGTAITRDVWYERGDQFERESRPITITIVIIIVIFFIIDCLLPLPQLAVLNLRFFASIDSTVDTVQNTRETKSVTYPILL